MSDQLNKRAHVLDSMVVTGILLAAFYWVCESFMFFFLSPEKNIFHHLFGPDLFEVWTRILVLSMFLICRVHAACERAAHGAHDAGT